MLKGDAMEQLDKSEFKDSEIALRWYLHLLLSWAWLIVLAGVAAGGCHRSITDDQFHAVRIAVKSRSGFATRGSGNTLVPTQIGSHHLRLDMRDHHALPIDKVDNPTRHKIPKRWETEIAGNAPLRNVAHHHYMPRVVLEKGK